MLLDVQIAASQFCRMVRQRLRAIPIPLGCDLVASEDTEALDRIDILDDTTVRRDPVARQTVWFTFPNNYTSLQLPAMQIQQRVAIRRVEVADLRANGSAPSPHVTPELIVTLTFNVWMTTNQANVGTGGAAVLHAQFDQIDYGILDALVPAALKALLNARLTGLSLPDVTVDLGFLGKYASGAGAYNAAIACDTAGTTVTMRFDLGKDGDFGPAFYTQDAENLLQGAEWAVALDSRLFTVPLAKQIHDALAKTANVKITQAPTASWQPAGPGVQLYTEIEALAACPFFVDDLDMDVAANLSLTFGRAPSGALRTRFAMQVGPSDPLEVIACAATASLLWPFVGAVLTDKYDLNVGVYFGGLILPPLARMLGMMTFLTSAPIPIAEPSAEHCTKIGDGDYQCDEPWNVTLPGFGGRLELQTVRGIGRGLVLAGRIDQQAAPPTPRILDVVVKPFAWQLEGQCRKAWNIVNKAEIFVAQVPTVRIWSACRLNDVHDEFVVEIADQTITVRPRHTAAYAQSPYPLELRLLTDQGVRTITLAPPVRITRRQRQRLQVARNRAIASCYRWEKGFTRLERILWLVDPPFRLVEPVQSWQFAISGMPAGSAIAVTTGRRLLLRARPSARGVAHFIVFTGRDGLRPSLELRGMNAAPGEQRVTLSQQQLLFSRVATVAAPPDLLAMHFERLDDAPVLVLQSATERHDIALRNPPTPVLAAVTQLERPAGLVTVHTGRAMRLLVADRLPAAPVPNRRTAGAAILAAPKTGGVGTPWFVGDRDGGVLLDLDRRDGDRPMPVHEYPAAPWFADTAIADELLARHDPATDTVGIWRLAGSSTC
ncbi:MAG: hypothetical protein IPK26_07985 [Planctomycetes bacterium]|nr:hypothetical protein [Planctomycetota bacterium]